MISIGSPQRNSYLVQHLEQNPICRHGAGLAPYLLRRAAGRHLTRPEEDRVLHPIQRCEDLVGEVDQRLRARVARPRGDHGDDQRLDCNVAGRRIEVRAERDRVGVKVDAERQGRLGWDEAHVVWPDGDALGVVVDVLAQLEWLIHSVYIKRASER